MSKRNSRKWPLALALTTVFGLVSVVEAIGTTSEIVIIAPISVFAGNPINGQMYGGDPPMTCMATDYNGNLLPGRNPQSGYRDPQPFSFPTVEPMAGTVVDLFATEPGGTSDIAPVAVL